MITPILIPLSGISAALQHGDQFQLACLLPPGHEAAQGQPSRARERARSGWQAEVGF